MSTTLNGRQAVVPRRRSEPKTRPTVDQVTPTEEAASGPVLLCLPDLSTTVAERERELLGPSPAMGGGAREETSPAIGGEGQRQKRRERRLKLEFNPAEFWQSGKGKLIVSGTLLAGALLLFAFLGPKTEPTEPVDAPPVDEWVETERDAVPSDELVGPLDSPRASAEPDRLNLGVKRSGFQNDDRGQLEQWGPENNGTATQNPRLSDSRGKAGAIPTFRIDKTYSTPESSRSAGPVLNRQGQRKLSLEYYQSKLPGNKSSR